MLKDEALKLADRIREAMRRGANRKEIADMLVSDYRPRNGGTTSCRNLTNAQKCEDPTLRCNICTGHDIQSGPFYCGKMADVVLQVADNTSRIVPLCQGHYNECKWEIEAGERERAKARSA